MRFTDAPAQRPIREPRRVAPLRYAERLTLPVGQKVSARSGPWDTLVQGILSAVKGDDFTIVESSLGSDPRTGTADVGGFTGGLIAERRVRRVATGRSMRVSVAVLVGAGIGLGALDVYIVGSVIFAVPWIAVAALGAFLLWLRYGRSYQSEVLAVGVSLAPPLSGKAPTDAEARPTTEVEWRVGRIRSVTFSGIRAAVEVEDCPVSLMEALVRAVRRFQSNAS